MNICLFQKPLIALSLATASFYFSQNKAEDALLKFEKDYPQEKVHLIFNKDHYVAGENIWFKSFVFDGYNRSDISTSLFVEMYDRNKKLINKKMIPLLNGEGSGSFSLSKTLQEDVFFIRAYTTWMTNFSEDFNYLQPITVYNPESPKKLQADTEAAWSATVHPEGGTFIEGILTKFAVRLHSQGFAPSEWSGTVTEAGKPDVIITQFKGFDQNVGSFNLTAQAGKQYQLTIEDKNGKKQTISLPQAENSGISLHVESTDNAVQYSIQSKNIADNQVYTMIGTINNQMVFKAAINKMSGKTFSIPADKLINGVLQITIFDSNENVVAQRLCFVQPNVLNIKKPSLSPDLNVTERGKNSINIGNNSHYNSYSVLVTDSSDNTSEDENSLLSSLWLTGDFSSNIFKPAQYFTKNHNSEALDALLISEKYKRFEWKNIISGKYPVIRNKPQSYISYKGKVMSQGKPAAHADLNLIFKMPDAGMKFHTITTDANGLFSIQNLAFEDSMKFSYQLNTKDKAAIETTQVYFQPNFSFVPLGKALPESRMLLTDREIGEKLPEKVAKSVENLNSEKFIHEKITVIEEVKIKADKRNKTQKLNETLSSPMFKSTNEMVFDFVNENNGLGATNILQWLQGRVPGLQISSMGANASATMRGGPVEIFIDEMRTDPSQVSMISVAEIAMVKVIRGAFVGSSGGGNGAIVIYTRRGGITGSVPDNGQSKTLKDMTLKGYDKEEPFKNDIYDEVEAQSLSKDSRSTLYWNPFLLNVPKEPTKINFYNNDDAKEFKVLIIGFDENDVPLYYNEVLK